MQQNCDVAVIGGGIAGVSAGYEIAADASVTVLEAEPALATHATGRSAATYVPSDVVLQDREDRYMRPLMAASLTRFAELEADAGGSGWMPPRSMLWIGIDDESAAAVEGFLAAGAGLERTSVVAAHELCPALRPDTLRNAALDSTALEVDVMAIHGGYAAGLRRRGGSIHTGAEVTAIARTQNGWRVSYTGGTLECAVIVNAAGAWADHVAALADVPPIGIVPRRRSLFGIQPQGIAVGPGWPLVNDALDRFYFLPDGGQLKISPGDATQCEPHDAQPDHVEIARAIKQLNAYTTLALGAPSWALAGLRSGVPDGKPVVGSWAAEPGFFFLAGQGGGGIQLAPGLAALAAAAVLNRPVPADIGIASGELAPRSFAS